MSRHRGKHSGQFLVVMLMATCVAGITAAQAARAAAPVTTVPTAPSGPATPQQVQQAIERAQRYLLDHRAANGTWEEVPAPLPGGAGEGQIDPRRRQWGGLTSIATYALLASGKDYRDDQLKVPINFLLQANIQGTYGLGLSSQIVLFLPEAQTRTLMKRNVGMLLLGLIQPQPGLLKRVSSWPPEAGFYGYWTGAPEGTKEPLMTLDPRAYGTHQPRDWYDRSNSQYGVLGMWALSEAGAEVPTLYWEIVDAAWKRSQMRDGGWNYRDGEDQRASMTAAGVATLFITQDYTLNENWGVCKGGIKNEFIERGLRWMDAHIGQALDTGDYYTMYGVERIGTASGRKYFGTRDWFQIGADYLVKHQRPDGSWTGNRGVLPDTSFGLLFLARGRAPVLMNKLQYDSDSSKGPAEAWDERPRDVANLAKWVGKQEESYFNWQVVNLKVSPEDLHDAPILYISGASPLSFSAQEVDKLRAFVNEGGMILGNADCGQNAFAASFTKLGKALFPRYDFHAVSANDLIWHEQFTQWRVKPKVMELTNGVRKLMLLIPDADPSRAWQTRSDRTREPMYQLGANIFLYAVDKTNLLAKGETYLVRPDGRIKATKAVKVARLDVGENPDPEPAAWPRFAAIMHNQYKLDVQRGLVKPEALSSAYKIADLTGTGKLVLGESQRSALRQFVEHGGTLIVDAAGGNATFADSVIVELKTIFGEDKLEPLPDDSPVYNQPGDKITKVLWRQYATTRLSDRRHPHLRGVTVGAKRIGVLFSAEDLTAGLVGQPVDGIHGYAPKTAADLMAAMVMYAAGGK